MVVKNRRSGADAIPQVIVLEDGANGVAPDSLTAWSSEARPKTSPTVPTALRERILGFERQENWDEEGGHAIPAGACRASVDFIEGALNRQPALSLPRASASLRGAVTLTWRFPDRSFSLFFSDGDRHQIDFQLEGPGYQYKTGAGSWLELMDQLLALEAASCVEH